MSRRDYDVLIASDFRHGGGTTASIAQEVEIQARMGLRTGLVQVDATYLAAGPWADRIRGLVAAGLAEDVHHTEAATARLLVLRHPRVFAGPRWSLAARGDRTLMIANQVPADGARDKPYYDVATVRARLRAQLGIDPAWAPIGPAVREALGASVEVTPTDWHNVIDADAWAPRGARARTGPIVIGRHSRDDVKKWPERRADLLAAYPDDGSRDVRVLGGATAVAKLLGRRPRTWHVQPFGSVPPEAFLAGLDVFVYFHHSGMREAFGRAILEALASGLPVITHRYLERVFGDACTYCEPSEVPRVLDQLMRTRGEPNARGLALVRERYDWEEHRRRLAELLPSTPPPIARRPPRKRRVLFVSSNGGGLGHLTRLLSIARRLPDDHEARFLTMSSGLDAIARFGFPADYLPSREASGLGGAAWQRYVDARVTAALRAYKPAALVFDGTMAYPGLVDAIARFPALHKVWSRRGLWRDVGPNRVRHSLLQLAAFDLVLEPGELAASIDRGPTAAQRTMVRPVAPVLLLDGAEQLPRDLARNELGIPADRVAVLLNLGAGNINRLDEDVDRIVGELATRPDVHLVAAQSLIAARALPIDPERVTRLEIYPLGRVLAAFDACIAAPGYNAFHELLAAAVPTLFIPNTDTALDDQAGRAAWAASHGVALTAAAGDADAQRAALVSLLDRTVRLAIRERCLALPRGDGAREAASLIAEGARLDARAAIQAALRPLAWPARWARLRERITRVVRREPRAVAERNVVVAPAADLAALRKTAVTAEVLPVIDATEPGDRLEQAHHALLALRAISDAYGAAIELRGAPDAIARLR